jgi:hypothetical protein
MPSKFEETSWESLLDTRPSATLDEIKGAVYEQTGLGRPHLNRVRSAPRYVEDEQALADLHEAIGTP